VRRSYFLDPSSALDDDIPMQQRIERIFAELHATPRPRPGPARDELLTTMQAAVASRLGTRRRRFECQAR
jgi:hypothetical protein